MATTKINLYDIMYKQLDGIQYKPLTNFIKFFDVERQDDPAGNGDDIYKADNIDYIERWPERHGYDDGTDKAIYNQINPDIDHAQVASRLNAIQSVMDLWKKHAALED